MKKFITPILIILLFAGAIILVKNKINANNATLALVHYDLNVKSYMPQKKRTLLTQPAIVLVKNDSDTILSTKSSAYVLSILSSGTLVKKGDVIARIDNSDLTTQKIATKLSLDNAIASHQRSLELFNVKGVSIEQLQTEESHIATLKAELKRISDAIDYTIVRSPVDGTVGKTFVSVGEITTPGKPIASIKASNGSYGLIRLAQGAPAKALEIDNQTVPLRFLQNNNGLDEYRTIQPLMLPSGARTEGKLVVFEGEGVFVPTDAVLLKNNQAYVLLIKDHKATPLKVSIVAQGDEGFIIDTLPSQKIVVAKSDILLKILSGASIQTKAR